MLLISARRLARSRLQRRKRRIWHEMYGPKTRQSALSFQHSAFSIQPV